MIELLTLPAYALDLENNKYNNIINKCGVTCDDCASIFENDLLYDIENILKSNNDIEIYLVKEV